MNSSQKAQQLTGIAPGSQANQQQNQFQKSTIVPHAGQMGVSQIVQSPGRQIEQGDDPNQELINEIRLNEAKSEAWYQFIAEEQVGRVRNYLDNNLLDFSKRQQEFSKNQSTLQAIQKEFTEVKQTANKQKQVFSQQSKKKREHNQRLENKRERNEKELEEMELQIAIQKLKVVQLGCDYSQFDQSTKLEEQGIDEGLKQLLSSLFYVFYDIQEYSWQVFQQKAFLTRADIDQQILINLKQTASQVVDESNAQSISDQLTTDINKNFRDVRWYPVGKDGKEIIDKKAQDKEKELEKEREKEKEKLQKEGKLAVPENKDIKTTPAADNNIILQEKQLLVQTTLTVSAPIESITYKLVSTNFESFHASKVETLRSLVQEAKIKDSPSYKNNTLNLQTLYSWVELVVQGINQIQFKEEKDKEVIKIKADIRKNEKANTSKEDDMMSDLWQEQETYASQIIEKVQKALTKLDEVQRIFDDGKNFIVENVNKFNDMLRQVEGDLQVDEKFIKKKPKKDDQPQNRTSIAGSK